MSHLIDDDDDDYDDDNDGPDNNGNVNKCELQILELQMFSCVLRNIYLSIKFFENYNHCSFLNLRDQVSHLYKINNNIIYVYLKSFYSLESTII
jgi:hypothetical protein